VVRVALTAALAILTTLSIPLWLLALGRRAGPALSAVLILLTLSSYAVLEGLFADQVGLIAGFLLAATFAALAQDRLALAGSLFAFTFIKPQISVVVAAYLLLWSASRWRERRRFVYGFLAWSAALGGLSLVVWPRWIPQWLHVLAGYGNYAPPPLITNSLGPALGSRLGPYLIVVLLAAALIVMWRARGAAASSAAFMLTVSLLLALTSITLLPGQAVYDHVVLLPGILLAVFTWRAFAAESRPFAMILAVAALALFWQWMMAIPVLAARCFIPAQKFFSSGLLLLPLHAAASVPLAVTAVLGFMMWRDMRKSGRQETQARPAATSV
jgi:Glycosyltransferase family 87